MFGQSSQATSPHQNKEKLCIILYPQTYFFYIQPQRFSTLNPVDLYVWENFKYLVQSLPVENGKTLHQRVLDACQTIRNPPGIFESVRQSTIGTVHMCTDSGGGHLL
jgi:hypothetical protein